MGSNFQVHLSFHIFFLCGILPMVWATYCTLFTYDCRYYFDNFSDSIHNFYAALKQRLENC